MVAKRITEGLLEIGACWAVSSEKYCSPNDPLEDQIAGRRTYHVHPDASFPHQLNIKRFDSLAEIGEYIRARREADAAVQAGDEDKAWEIMAEW